MDTINQKSWLDPTTSNFFSAECRVVYPLEQPFCKHETKPKGDSVCKPSLLDYSIHIVTLPSYVVYMQYLQKCNAKKSEIVLCPEVVALK